MDKLFNPNKDFPNKEGKLEKRNIHIKRFQHHQRNKSLFQPKINKDDLNRHEEMLTTRIFPMEFGKGYNTYS